MPPSYIKRSLFGLVILAIFGVFLKFQNAKIPQNTTSNPRSLSPREPSTPTLWLGGPEKLRLAEIDHGALLKNAKRSKHSGRYRFATAREVFISPETHGQWTRVDGISRWQFEVESVGARSLNFGFTEYLMPAGGFLSLSAPETTHTFTAKDNDAHGELWTPIMRSDRIAMAVEIPTALEGDLQLTLTKVNHGFREANPLKNKIGNAASGACNIDVICSAADDSTFGPLIDTYRDQIRSVAAYTLSGVDVCSGALINNTRRDARPFFLTANHCGVTTNNARSMVLFWNFENQSCRTPGSTQSGRPGNGPINIFNSGAIFRASFALSDFCLVELDDPVNPEANAFFAGWDRRDSNSSSTIAIHHPGVSEKRISFDLQPTTTTFYSSNQTQTSGTHLRVADWDFGTTEGGSSGSPLFNEAGQIIGQLHGGGAACGNNLPDWYGRIFRSWTGGGSSGSRLSDWLDPDNTGETSIPGTDAIISASITAENGSESDGENITIAVSVKLKEAAEERVSVRLSTEDGTAMANSDFLPLDEEIFFDPGETEKSIEVVIISDDIAEEDESFFLVLSKGSGAFPGSNSRVSVTIFNDDFIPPVITNDNLTRTIPSQDTFTLQVTARNTPQSYRLENAPAEMTINPETGLISWFPPEVGTFTADAIAVNSAGEGRQTFTLVVEQNELVQAVDLPITIPLTNANPGFFRQTSVTHDGVDAAQSNAIGDNESASFSISVEGPDAVSFWWKSSTEANFDFFIVSLDGAEIAVLSGETDWTRRSLFIPAGSHTVTWTYSKDLSFSDGRDQVWIDEIELASLTGEPVITSAERVTTLVNEEFSFQLDSIDPTASFTLTELPDGLFYNGIDTIFGTPTRTRLGRVTVTATATNGEVSTSQLTIAILEDISDPLDTSGPVWNLTGDGFWQGQSQVTYDGEDALRIGPLTDFQSASFSSEVTGPDEIAFWWKVSSEEFFDVLTFRIDGELQSVISGEVDWTRRVFKIPPGRHLLEWSYLKDESTNGGSDNAWVDEIVFRSDQTPFIQAVETQYALRDEALRLPIGIANSVTSSGLINGPDWLTWDQETQTLSGTPPRRLTYRFTLWAENDFGRAELPVELEVFIKNPALGSAADLTALPFFNTQLGSWTEAEEAGREGGTVLSSGNVSNDRLSEMSTLVQGPGRLTFDWAVSSEPLRDFLELWVDGIPFTTISGEEGWSEEGVTLSEGLHRISWIYRRDASGSGGRNRGFIDNVRLSGYSGYLTQTGINHLDSAMDDDLDEDGLGLFSEYAFERDPNKKDGDNLLFIQDSSRVGFRGVESPFDIDYLWESSLDLDDWQAPTETPTTANARDGYIDSLIEFNTADQGRRFFRIEAQPKAVETRRDR